MSRSRHQRHFDPLEERYLIETLGDARHACLRASGKVEINGDLYKALQKLTECRDRSQARALLAQVALIQCCLHGGVI